MCLIRSFGQDSTRLNRRFQKVAKSSASWGRTLCQISRWYRELQYGLLGFLTVLDHFALASTVVVFLSMVEVIYTAHLAQSDRPEKARRVDRHARWIAPVAYSAITTETLFLRIGL
jgi:hypothetical protein